MKFFSHGTTIKNPLEIDQNNSLGVTKRAQKIDAKEKVLGQIPYTDDIILPRMVYGKIIRSPHPHAKIISINKKSIDHIEGILLVVTGEDLQQKYGVIPWTKDEYPLAFDKARYVGDAVAAVIATNEYAAHKAALELEIKYEILPAILNCHDAKTNSQVVVNERAKIGNITKHVDLSFGDVEENLKNSSIVLSENFSFHNTTHAPIEPHCAIGDFSAQGLLTVYSATQVPHYLHRSLSEVLQLNSEQIRVIQPPVGGAFGGKSEPFDLEFVVAFAAKQLKRPVKILYTREEVFLAHRGRHPMQMHMTMGVSDQGKILALRNLIDIDGGAYASFGMITAFYAGQLLSGPVGMKSYHFVSTRYYTNKPACGPKRGHGSVQPRFAFEILCDMAAEKLQIDPILFRKRNAIKEGSKTVNGLQVGSLALTQALDQCAKISKWYERRGHQEKNRGLGVACSMYISGTNYPVYPNDMPQSAVSLRIDRSGRVIIASGCSDIGQGANTILAQIAAQELGVSFSQIKVFSGDSDLTPVDLGAYSSRVTLMMGHAAQEACKIAREKIADCVWQFFNHDDHFKNLVAKNIHDNAINFEEGRVFLKENKEVSISFKKAIEIAESKLGSLNFSGNYRTVDRGGEYRGGTIGASPAYSCTAHIADVSVDTTTGKIIIHNIYVAHDCGKALNPSLVEGQIEGSTYMGAAEVNLEHFICDEEEHPRKGLLTTASLLDYRIPTSLDTPNIFAEFVEHPDKNGPYGAKEAGEGPLHSAIPAVANAIYNAVGVRLFHLPFSPQKILSALKSKGEKL